MTNIDKELLESAREALATAEGKLAPARVMISEGVDVTAIRKQLNRIQDKIIIRHLEVIDRTQKTVGPAIKGGKT